MKLPTTPSLSLNGKRALVTGASSGIGQACAVAMAQAGAHVVCAARGADRLQETVAAMKAQGLGAEGLILDQSDLGALKTALA
ncbi:MAG: SDR family NAD(P)-dependent oxidoreductase, partial [Rhodobacteraceae bacterium]|nr:SDR family NAD(P)-dependent oxidoreductase [Paracoccaceae bacterium]